MEEQKREQLTLYQNGNIGAEASVMRNILPTSQKRKEFPDRGNKMEAWKSIGAAGGNPAARVAVL